MGSQNSFKKKDLNFLQANIKNNLPMIGDIDKDQVPNLFDCKPYDPNRDGVFGRALNVLSGGRFGQTKKDYETEKIDRINKLEQKAENDLKILNKKNELIKTKLKTQQLMAEQQQLMYLHRLGPSPPNPTQILFSAITGAPTPTRGMPLGKPGYKIVYEPKLPKGYHWKKISKKEKKQENKQYAPQDYVEHKFISYQEAQFVQNHIKQIYGYTPEIFRVKDKFTGMVFFMVVEPTNLIPINEGMF
jgi:hypothetical protein